MTGTRTGNGGFEIDGKVYDLDVGDPSAPGLDPIAPDKGDINVDDTKKDVSKKTRSTLGRYLSDLTLGKEGSAKGNPNAYPVDPPRSPSEPNEISLTDPNGLPSPIVPTENSTHFESPNPQGTGGSVFDSPDLRDWSSVQPDASTKLTNLGKGKEGKKTNGNNLLSNVAKNKTSEPIETYRATVLSTNRFTANAQTYDPTAATQPVAGPPKFRIKGNDYSENQLKQVGVMLSLRGSQEFPAAFNDSVNPVNAGSVAGALLPSPNQLGVLKVPNKILEAIDALQTLSDQDDEPAPLDIAPLGNQSWGALNNVEEPWSGTLNLGMVAMALALQSALLLAFEGLGSLIGLMGDGKPNTPGRNPNGAYTKGSYLSRSPGASSIGGFPPDVMTLLGIHGTMFPFGDALKVGTVAFFLGGDQAKAKTGIGAQLAFSLSSAASATLSDNSSAGYLIIVSRLIVRTGQEVAAQVQKISAAFSSNPISGIKAIAGLLDIIKQSKLIAAINIFTTLGDAVLSEDSYSKDLSGTTEAGIYSSIDAIDANAPTANVKKNRIKKPNDPSGNALKLAWASNRSPASYLIPESLATMALADTKLGGFRGPMGANDPDSRSYLVVQTDDDRKANGARIPHSSPDPRGIDVKKMEALLEAEYMPFYFHDIRTNEIISFQAFLVSLNDDYTANWETIDGYGRVDPVKIYKSTARRIGMSFYVIATDKKDFDEMWMKLNKLVTLVYPQYTKGRTLTDGTNTTFVQPFSQLIGASPLIRIRLGDLFRSNYSRFALARLFGAGDGDMVLDGQPIRFQGAQKIVSDGTSAQQAIDIITKAQNDAGSRYHLSSAGWASAMSSGVSVSLPFGSSGPSSPDQAPSMKIDEGDLGYFEFTITGKLGDSMVAVAPAIVSASDLVNRYGLDDDSARAQFNALNERYNSDQSPATKVVGGPAGYAVPLHALRLTPQSLNKAYAEMPGISDAIQNIEQLSAFLDVEKNALVKSFRSIQGKGLGGVIETMGFDWYDKVTWEIDPGSRAPKMCKVTIAFAPIHDISPGIDHMGYNRSPLYPVGNLMGQGFDPDKSS